MKIFQQRQYDRFLRSAQFLDQNAADFAPNAKALAFGQALKEVLGNIEEAENTQNTGKAGNRASTSAKLFALNALREELYDIEATATVIAQSDLKFKNVFEVTDWRRKEELVATAKRFFKDAKKVTAKFEAYEMSGDFLERLQNSIAAYEATQVATPDGQGKAERKDELAELIGEGARLAGFLGVLVRNKYRGDGEKLEAWNTAWVK